MPRGRAEKRKIKKWRERFGAATGAVGKVGLEGGREHVHQRINVVLGRLCQGARHVSGGEEAGKKWSSASPPQSPRTSAV